MLFRRFLMRAFTEMSVEESKQRLASSIPLILADLDFESFNVFTALDGAGRAAEQRI